MTSIGQLLQARLGNNARAVGETQRDRQPHPGEHGRAEQHVIAARCRFVDFQVSGPRLVRPRAAPVGRKIQVAKSQPAGQWAALLARSLSRLRPEFRIPSRVQYCEYDDALGLDSVKDRIWEA